MRTDRRLFELSGRAFETGILVSIFLASCVNGSAQEMKYPCALPEDIRTERMVYARRDKSDLALQVFVKGKGNERAQAVVIVPDTNSRTWQRPECYAISLAQKGLVAAVADYRTARTALYPAAIDDIVAAVSALRESADRHDLRVNAVGLLGFGFGGLVASSSSFRSDEVGFVVTVDAVSDLTKYGYPIEGDYPYLYHAFLGVSRAEDPDKWKEASPITHVSAITPPHLIIAVENGGQSSISQMEEFSRRFREQDARVGTAKFPSAKDMQPGGPNYDAFVDRLGTAFTNRLYAPDRSLTWTQNIAYTTNAGRQLHLDVLRDSSIKGPRPAVLWFHGGGYVWGQKRDRSDLTEALAHKGYVVFSVEYTRASYRKAPAMFLDGHAAVAWIRDHAVEFGVDPNRIAAVGESAGGHLAALLGIESEFTLEGDSPADIQAVVTISGVIDIPRLADRDWYSPGIVGGVPLEQGEKFWRRMSPAFRAHPKAAPFLALQGTQDELGTVEEMEIFAKELRSYGIRAEVLPLEGGEYDFWNFEKYRGPAMRRMLEFLGDVLGGERKP